MECETGAYEVATASLTRDVIVRRWALDEQLTEDADGAGRQLKLDRDHKVHAGGRQTVYTMALNWYVNRNVRFMFDYLHGNIAKQVSATNFGDTGSKCYQWGNIF